MSKDVQLLEGFLKKQSGQFTIGDAASVTGLPVLETKYGLRDLMKKYTCKLNVTDQGELLYDFGESLSRRDAVPFSERLAAVGQLLWKGFTLVYKACIAVVLVVYFVVFLVLLIALIVAMMSGGNKSDKRGGGGGGAGIFRIVGEIFGGIFRWNTHHSSVYIPRDQRGYPYEHYEPRQTHLPKKKAGPHKDDPKHQRNEDKSFIASVYDFVFGPPRVPLDTLSNQRELATYLKENKGVVSVSEVQALAGWRRDEASEFLTESLALFDGEPEISENGTLVARFDSLIKSGGEVDHQIQEPVVYFWNEYVPEWELTGNHASRNLMIMGMNVFNLIFASFVMGGGVSAVLPQLGLGAMTFLGIFPFAFSLLFFLIPAVRWVYVKKKQKEQHIENIRRRLLHVIFRKHSQEIKLSELTDTANRWRTTEEQLSSKIVDQVVNDFIDDFKGEASASESGEVVYKFYRLNSELLDLEEVRQLQIGDKDPGRLLEF